MFENLIAPKWENTKLKFSQQQWSLRVPSNQDRFCHMEELTVMWGLKPHLGNCLQICYCPFPRAWRTAFFRELNPGMHLGLYPWKGTTERNDHLLSALPWARHLYTFYGNIIWSFFVHQNNPINSERWHKACVSVEMKPQVLPPTSLGY